MSSGNRPPSCVPTWHGHVETTKDALLIFQACFDGVLQHCSRRPHDRERANLIASGNVFVYEEQTSGIKRWTDGIPWSPSRILTNFLIYRQLNSPFPPGEKKRATKRNIRTSKGADGYSTPTSATNTPIMEEPRPFPPQQPPDSPLQPRRSDDDSPEKDSNRGLVGSLVDSYEFKEGGLLKKTMTVTVNHIQHHLVSYYTIEDAKSKLKTPREDTRLKNLVPNDELLKQPKFKFPNFDDAGDGTFETHDPGHATYNPYYPAYGGHYGYGYPNAQAYGHPGAYAAPHHPGYSMAPANAMYAPTAGHYGQPQHAQYPPYSYPQVQHQQQQAPPQQQHQYHSNYPQQQHAQQHPAHQAPLQQHGQPMTPIKPEPAPTHAAQYDYHTPAQSHGPVSHGYAPQQSNGVATTSGEEDHVAQGAPSQAPPVQPPTWQTGNPAAPYQQWPPPRTGGPQSYGTYRPPV